MNTIIGLLITILCIIGGFYAMGGNINILIQPFEIIIVAGAGLGGFVMANPLKIIKDSGISVLETFGYKTIDQSTYCNILKLLYILMYNLKKGSRNEIENHIDDPYNSTIFNSIPTILENHELTTFICDYIRMLIIGNARSYEIENLMDEELDIILYEKLKTYHAMSHMSESFPAIGIIGAILGIIKAMGNLSQSPKILGAAIGVSLTGTLLGILLSYCVCNPLIAQIKSTKLRQHRLYIMVKKTLIAYMNGAVPQVAIEYGRKVLPLSERPSIEIVEQEVLQYNHNTQAS
ncbi:flagellar motor stator protein MotA [Candidatus Liberibacter africanus]|uniref:Flagellar motor protein MotA n=1 Tax=Candidatus Liberibacter africanus PTSAPSY TaxID=1277257 RepID=A0A0G3I299_LIBAF|nr:flagellar motor stator protein MotA [Candidatus Liberibacter africanus]AKK19986.1 flagellar motor protein MotA [Candidatus Liberibacter africanus PTSAPSY]QTP63818.1 flagellar motor stator protein MotA [Candidatus Liberibacter africanus]